MSVEIEPRASDESPDEVVAGAAPAEESAAPAASQDVDPVETEEWLDALEAVVKTQGPDRAAFLVQALRARAHEEGVRLPFTAATPYINTIPPQEQPPYPGNRRFEREIKNLIRWNAMAMVVRANKKTEGGGAVGGHIATYASAATLYEVGFNHFFRGPNAPGGGDIVYIQGHASPGIYSRAFLEGVLSEKHLENFRQELQPGGGLSSYPHPWLMPNFWQFPTVSMGLSPLTAIYQARFNRYLQDRGIKDTSNQKVWAFLGDGECDEPETLGALTLAAREQLDNLIFVVNCNLQRLDGPVRGNFKIIQELEAAFRGAGWNVIKVVWGDDWDPLLARDETGALVARMNEACDGDFQKYVVAGGAYIRSHFFGKSPGLLKLVEHLSDEQLEVLGRGGHDPDKVYAAYKAAVEHKGAPTVILAKTIKGYGMGDAGEARNTAHQIKKLQEDAVRHFRTRFSIPISDDDLAKLPFQKPAQDSPELEYMRRRREALGGSLPQRRARSEALPVPTRHDMADFFKPAGTAEKPVSTTMFYGRLLAFLLTHPGIGKRIVPIIPDEARTFGLEPLFSRYGIYSHIGQRYEPVDLGQLVYYREAKDGQMIEEGITEAGSMASFIAAGTSYSTHNVPMIPLYIYYSMFGFQRVGDLIWAAADSRARGFLLGATAGRTALNGEGLQHEDGHSHVAALAVPNLMAYDPAFGYELAVIVQDGMRRMYAAGEDVFYYVTLYNENYEMPAMPAGVEDGILRGMYKFRERTSAVGTRHVQLLGSGCILPEVLKAQEILAERYGVSSTVWSVTSYKELRRDALEIRRWNMLHPDQPARLSYLEKAVGGAPGPFVAASDYMRALPEQIAAWLPGGLTALGTDGFGRSDTRRALRRFFEVDAAAVTVAALYALCERRQVSAAVVKKAIEDLEIDTEQPAPWTV
jgi:pyruvate dehydrogenase E1 component